MKTNDEVGQEPDDEKSNGIHVNEMIETFSEKVLLVKSERTILQEASQEIHNVLSKGLQEGNESTEVLSIDKSNKNVINDCSQQKELQKQVSTGEITPFQAIEKNSTSSNDKGTVNKPSQLLDLEKYLKQQAELAKKRKQLNDTSKTLSNKDKAIPAKKAKLFNHSNKVSKTVDKTKRKNIKKSVLEVEQAKDVCEHDNVNCEIETKDDNTDKGSKHSKRISIYNTGENTNNREAETIENDSGSEYIPSDDQIDSEDEAGTSAKRRKGLIKTIHTRRVLDDGDEEIYKQRVIENGCPKNESLHKVDNLFKVPQSIWKRLYRYQRVSVQWLWELHCRDLGGLLGDEMGLGKTVQVIAFLAGLDCSELLSDGGRFRGLGSTLIVCPATLMEQWLKHFHEWWPTLRVVVLHQSGTYCGDLEYLIHSLQPGGILITSYNGVLRHKDLLVAAQWHYVILDEGHKIRNPQAKVSKAVKEFSTPHRLLLTGSPMQNSLKELWSLFDFILPGKLGTLPAFLEHCASPITRGGYANATPLQEATALQVATMLRDAITPYMLRRTKNDVQHHVNLPEKNEQVLFCSLTEEQKKLYKKYLHSEDVSFVLHEKNYIETGRYRARMLIALSTLRKICNHPDLYLYTSPVDSDDDDINVSETELEKFGYWKRAGKMAVVRSLLKIWKKQKHRVLLFTQGRQMMHILESLVQSEEYKYLRMDGTTPMSQRQETIRLFNSDPSYFIFLLTTRVGGLGVNLTGANRVVIYDPDWNPATDAQARERAWRIGQHKRVTIYRLITAGTIEEKIYHRQIFKLLLSNKVLEDPRQRKLFKTSDLVELFNFNEYIDGRSSESDQLFRDSKINPTSTKFSSSKVEKMRKLAATLSKSISQNISACTPATQTTNEPKTSCILRQDNNNDSNNCKNNNEIVKSNLLEDNIEAQSQLQKDVSEGNIEKSKNVISDNKKLSSETNSEGINAKEDATLDENSIHDSTRNNSNEIEILNKNCKTDALTKNETPNLKSDKSNHKHKQSRKRSHTKKNEVSAIFEGEHISHLIGRRLGRSQTDELISTEDDQYVLKKLFAKATVTSAFQHESVLSNSGCNPDDKNPMQRLAKETAQENMDSIRKSRKWCWKPTWDSLCSKND